MVKRNLCQWLGFTAISGCAVALIAPQANAGVLHNNWNYSIDSWADGSGGASYEIKGLATKETEDSIYFALTGGMPITGVTNNSAADKNIGWGDLFLNFSGKNVAAAEQEGSLLGIRFAETNDSGASQVGLYSNVTTKSVTLDNHGYSSLKQYYAAGYNKANTMGTDIATSNAAYSYLHGNAVANNPTTSNTTIKNVINTGNFLGGLDVLSVASLADVGLDFANFGISNAQTFGFKLSKSLLEGILPEGISPFMAHVFLECGNDAVALASSVNIPTPTQDVPEPTALVGLGLVGLAFLKNRSQSMVKA
jgi:hypothetical protein